jgi:tetratricopeptide (TPR) repeat protein
MKLRAILALAVIVLVSAGGWWWWHAGAQQALVARGLPTVPDLGSFPPALSEEVAAANARARGRLTTRRGLVDLSRLYHGNGFFAEALTCYGILEQIEPSEPRWLHLHASILANYGELVPAIKLWQRVTQLAPDNVAARLRLGDAFLKSNQAVQAAAEYEGVLKLRPDDSYALLGLARIDLEAKQWARAKERLEAVVRQTNFKLGYDLIVSLYERLGLRDEAAVIRGSAKASGAYRDFPDPWLNELMEVCYDPYRLGLTAGVAAQGGDIPGAIRLLQRAIRLAPDDVSSHFQLGGIAVAQNDLKLAREHFELCTQLSPTFSDGWAQLSDLQARTGESVAAERTLTEGLARCPDSPGLHLMRARNLRATNQAGAAISEYQTSIRLRPNEPDAYVELGTLFIDLGQENEGIRQMQLALEADPGEPTALGLMAFRAISTGHEVEARRWLNRVALQPRVPREQSSALFQAYQQAFRRPFTADRPVN